MTVKQKGLVSKVTKKLDDFYSDDECGLNKFELNNKGKGWGLNGYGRFTNDHQ